MKVRASLCAGLPTVLIRLGHGCGRSLGLRFLDLFPLVPVPFFLQDLEPADFLCRDVAPGNGEVRGVELQLQHTLE